MLHIAEGDPGAFEELYRRHSARALMLARKLCASNQLAEEVTQETFISLWRGAHGYRPALGSVSAWLSSMLRNRAIDAWRRASIRPVEVEAFDDGPCQLHSAVAADPPAFERADVLALIATLPPAQREAIFLAYFGGMTHAEIAARAGAPLGTIKGRIRLGLEKLRSACEEQPDRPFGVPAPAWPPLRALPGQVDELEPVRRSRARPTPVPSRSMTLAS